MARARLLKPDFFEDEKLTSLPLGARLLYSAIWCLADREGRLEDRPSRIAAFAFPPMGNQRVQSQSRRDTAAWLDALVSVGCVVRYETEGQALMYIPSWEKHQKIHPNETKSVLPPPMVTNGNQWQPMVSNVAGNELNRKEMKGKEAEGERDAPSAPSLPFVFAYVGRHQQRTAGRPPSPVQHSELVSLEREHGSELCFQAAEARGWDKPASYLRGWINDHGTESKPESREEAIIRLSRGTGGGVPEEAGHTDGVANGVSGLDRRSAAIARLGRGGKA